MITMRTWTAVRWHVSMIFILGCGATAPPAGQDSGGDERFDSTVFDVTADLELGALFVDQGVDLDVAGETTMSSAALCPSGFLPPSTTGTLPGVVLTEVSGVVASQKTPGVLWMHNDSGDEARLYAVSTEGALLGVLRLTDVTATDFEDIALGSCPDGQEWCLWVGDVGDNDKDRDHVVVYGLVEPELASLDPEVELSLSANWMHKLAYPQTAVDCEAIVVSDDALWFFEKTDGAKARVFRTQSLSTVSGTQTLDYVTTFDAPGFDIPSGRSVTGADWDPQTRSLAIRTYTGSFLFKGDIDDDVGQIVQSEPEAVAYGPLSETQGEAIAFATNEPGMWTVSEAEQGNQPIHFYGCAPSP